MHEHVYHSNTILIFDRYNDLKNTKNLHNLQKYTKSQYLLKIWVEPFAIPYL